MYAYLNEGETGSNKPHYSNVINHKTQIALLALNNAKTVPGLTPTRSETICEEYESPNQMTLTKKTMKLLPHQFLVHFLSSI